jgi:hypothetical protein
MPDARERAVAFSFRQSAKYNKARTKKYCGKAAPWATFMNKFAILSNRRRALIALAHSLVFLGIALRGFASPRSAFAMRGPGAVSSIVLVVIYVIVGSILAWLVTFSRCAAERWYFALCASSATFGLLRVMFGDAALPAAQYLRVVMLTAAVIVGAWIVRFFSRPVPEEVPED